MTYFVAYLHADLKMALLAHERIIPQCKGRVGDAMKRLERISEEVMWTCILRENGRSTW